MRHLGEVVFRHVCTHKAHIRARRGYEPTRETAMELFPESCRREYTVPQRTSRKIGSRQMAWGFEIGRIYNRGVDVHARFGGRQQGGIITSANHPVVSCVTGEAG